MLKNVIVVKFLRESQGMCSEGRTINKAKIAVNIVVEVCRNTWNKILPKEWIVFLESSKLLRIWPVDVPAGIDRPLEDISCMFLCTHLSFKSANTKSLSISGDKYGGIFPFIRSRSDVVS